MNEEIRLYIGNAHRDLDAAQSNIQQGYYHVAVSRAYYAMFYAASALLANQEIYRSKHSGVQSAFSEHFVKTGLFEREYARLFGNAYISRLESDYDAVFIVERTTAEDLVNDARRFVSRIERYFQDGSYEN